MPPCKPQMLYFASPEQQYLVCNYFVLVFKLHPLSIIRGLRGPVVLFSQKVFR